MPHFTPLLLSHYTHLHPDIYTGVLFCCYLAHTEAIKLFSSQRAPSSHPLCNLLFFLFFTSLFLGLLAAFSPPPPQLLIRNFSAWSFSKRSIHHVCWAEIKHRDEARHCDLRCSTSFARCEWCNVELRDQQLYRNICPVLFTLVAVKTFLLSCSVNLSTDLVFCYYFSFSDSEPIFSFEVCVDIWTYGLVDKRVCCFRDNSCMKLSYLMSPWNRQ